jgi:hypothetical protein
MVSGVWRGSRDVVLALHGRSFPSDDEWSEYIALVERAHAQLGDDWPRLVALALTDGGGPTGKHRAQLRSFLAGRSAPSVVLTTSRLARGIGAAVALFNSSIRFFAPRDFVAAARFLGLQPDEVDDLGETIARLAAPMRLAAVDELMSVVRARRRQAAPPPP